MLTMFDLTPAASNKPPIVAVPTLLAVPERIGNPLGGGDVNLGPDGDYRENLRHLAQRLGIVAIINPDDPIRPESRPDFTVIMPDNPRNLPILDAATAIGATALPHPTEMLPEALNRLADSDTLGIFYAHADDPGTFAELSALSRDSGLTVVTFQP